MPLPELIEIVPPSGPVQAQVTLPGSKSITNRALVLGALADGPVAVEGALWSQDTQVMVKALQRLGFEINVESESPEAGNRTITVHGLGGRIPNGGTSDSPLELRVGNAGTAARFLTALVCLGHGCYRLDGVPRMRERPQAELFQALRQLGYRIDSEHDRLPAVVHGGGPRRGVVHVSMHQSSQFASALLLAALRGQWHIKVVGENSDESPYIAMTTALQEAFPSAGGRFCVEPDASSGSYFCAADSLFRMRFGPVAGVTIQQWPTSGWQIDQNFPTFLPLPDTLSRRTDLGDSIMTAIVLAPLCGHSVQFKELGRLRVQECERVHALRTELARCGVHVHEQEDTLTVVPGPLHGADIETYHDHRMAMCFATLGLHVPGLRIKNPVCVAKTYPRFFHVLSYPPPQGLGVRILDANSRYPLTPEDLLP
jgi:3-phosphoshikimate 1-carboxyvinyltransferase